jgi:hypothetical protein
VNTTGDLNLLDNWDKTRPHVFVRHLASDPAATFQIALQPTTTAGDYAYVVGPAVASAAWTHLVVTWSETTRTGAAWANGVQLSQGTYAYDFSPTAEFFRLGEKLIGCIDETRVYGRVLTTAEIVALP